MKIYRFDTKSGVYLGEDFADEDPFHRGSYLIPPDATTIRPPPVAHGQILVFKIREQRWEVQPSAH